MNNQSTQEYYENNPSARWLGLASISISSFISSLNMSSVNVAVPEIALDLHANAILVSWVPTAFLLASVVVLLPAGRLADIYGRKKLYLLGIVIFTLACLMASVATSIEWLLFTRLLQGIGGALTFATGLAIVMSIFSTVNRGVALGIASGTLYAGLSLGPVVGGFFTEHYGWRSVFIFPVPLALLSVLLIVLKLKGEWKNDQPQKVDWLGSAILAIWSTALFIGVSIIPDPNAFLLLFVGTVFLFLFFYQQARSETPLIRLRAIMDNRILSHSLMASICTYASNFPLIFLFSLYLQFIRGMSPNEAGQIMALQAIMMAIVAPFAGRLSDLFEPRLTASAGCMLMAVAFAVLQTISTDTSIYLIGGSLMLLGIGFGLFTTPNNNAALASVEKTRLGIASALLSLARVMGNMLGTALMLLVMSIIVGQAHIEPGQYDALLRVIHWALAISCLFALLGGYLSFVRGNLRSRAE